jgi:hypothetical protein
MAEKRNPGGAAGARGVDRAGKGDHPLDTPDRAPRQGTLIRWNDRMLSVHAGRECLGHLLQNGRGWQAIGADDRLLGEFPTLDEARTAVRLAARAS